MLLQPLCKGLVPKVQAIQGSAPSAIRSIQDRYRSRPSPDTLVRWMLPPGSHEYDVGRAFPAQAQSTHTAHAGSPCPRRCTCTERVEVPRHTNRSFLCTCQARVSTMGYLATQLHSSRDCLYQFSRPDSRTLAWYQKTESPLWSNRHEPRARRTCHCVQQACYCRIECEKLGALFHPHTHALR